MNTDRRRRQTFCTVLLVTVCLFATLVSLVLADSSRVSQQWSHWTGAVLSVCAAIALVWRHERPWLVWLLAALVPIFFDTDATASLAALTAVLLTGGTKSGFGSVAGSRSPLGHAPWTKDAVAIGVTYLACVVALSRDAARPGHFSVLAMHPIPEPGQSWVYGAVPAWAPFLAAFALVVFVSGIALVRRSGRRVSAAEDVRDRAQEQEDLLREEVIRTEERTRIARDMHDTLAAALSRISLFAGGLQVSGSANPEKVASTAALIRETAHSAMADLRDIVGVLRDAREGGYGPRHQGVEGIAGIVAGARAAGIRVRLVEEQAPGTVGVVSGQAAYRVVQEALTNVQKHAPQQRCEVTVSGDEVSGLRIRVVNDVPPRSVSAIGSRVGLQGLMEIAVHVGGHCEAGPIYGEAMQGGFTPGGPTPGSSTPGASSQVRWLVDCWLPWHG